MRPTPRRPATGAVEAAHPAAALRRLPAGQAGALAVRRAARHPGEVAARVAIAERAVAEVLIMFHIANMVYSLSASSVG